MNDVNTKLILDRLGEVKATVDKISITIHGDGDEKLGLVRRVDGLAFELKTARRELKIARWVLGTVFGSVVLAGSEHWFESPTRPEVPAAKHEELNNVR